MPEETGNPRKVDFSDSIAELGSRLEGLASSTDNNNITDDNIDGDNINDHNNSAINSMRRRSSSTANVKPGLSFKDLNSIPFPVPESIPTTPGIEKYNNNQNIFDKTLTSQTSKYPLTESPIQAPRPALSKANSTMTSTANLLTIKPSSAPHMDPDAQDDDDDRRVDDDASPLDKMTLSNPPLNLYRLLCCCAWCATLGMSDGVLGALLPTIENYYNVSYAVVSLIWLGNAIGYVMIAFTAHRIDEKLGRHKMAVMSCLGLAIMFGIVASGIKKFPVIVVGFFFGGIGGASGLSQFNIFLSKFEKGTTYLGFFHGSYGFGAFISPLIATLMVENGGVKWNYYYFIPLCLSVANMMAVAVSFRGCEKDLAKWENDDSDHIKAYKDNGRENIELTDIKDEPMMVGEPVIESHEVKDSEKHNFKAALKDYRTWLICSFIFFYQGAEVSIGGWSVTYLLENRNVNKETIGYVASGFWGGVTLGRFILAPALPALFGVRRSVIILVLTLIVLNIVTWQVPNVYVAGVTISLTGFGIGPIYPMMVGLMTRILPRKIRFCALTLGTAFGSSGGSAIPFAVGMASEFVGTYILFPIVLVCLVGVLLSWLGQPHIERKGAINTLWQRIW